MPIQTLFDTSAFDRSDATISQCGLYRYDLVRQFNDGPMVHFIMLNPSTADASAPDPTMTRCLNRAKKMHFGGLTITNLFSLRSSDPRALLKTADPVGPDTDDLIRYWAKSAKMVIVAWGPKGAMMGRDTQVMEILDQLGVKPFALHLTKDGFPGHPLYVPMDRDPIPFPPSPPFS